MQVVKRNLKIDASRSRRLQILESLVIDGIVDTASLARHFDVSQATIQSDLLYLTELLPQLERPRGKLTYNQPYSGTYFGKSLRDNELLQQKQAIARAVVLGTNETPPLINSYDTVFLGPGSTIYYVCKQMALSGISYVICTNNLAIQEVSGTLSLFTLGGVFQREIWANSGEQTEEDFDFFLSWHGGQFNAVIIGTTGICCHNDSIKIFGHNASEKGLLVKCVQKSPKVIFVTGDPKLGKTDNIHFVDLDMIANQKEVCVWQVKSS